MFFPDRTPSTGALNMRECYRPYRAQVKDLKLEIWNTNYFRSTEGVRVDWKVLRNGEQMHNGSYDIMIAPGEKKQYDMSFIMPRDMSEYTYIITYMEGDRYIASEQFEVTPCIKVKPQFEAPQFKIEDKKLVVTSDRGKLVISKKTGEIESYCVDGVEYINGNNALGYRGILPNMYRKVLDNDRFIKIAWEALGLMKAIPCHRSTKFVTTDGVNIVRDRKSVV